MSQICTIMGGGFMANFFVMMMENTHSTCKGKNYKKENGCDASHSSKGIIYSNE